jgi:hypothetical protein
MGDFARYQNSKSDKKCPPQNNILKHHFMRLAPLVKNGCF